MASLEGKGKAVRRMRHVRGPLPREQSLKCFQCFTGTVKKLYESTADGTAVDVHRLCGTSTACMCGECVQYYHLVEKCVPIWHGPRGCPNLAIFANMIRNGQEVTIGRPATAWDAVTDALTENEIVYGGEKKLRDTILWVDKTFKPDIIPVFASCATGIIGDDIDTVIQQVKDQVNAIVIPHHTQGYRTMVWGTAFDICAHAWVHYIMEEPKKKEKGLVNIIVSWTHSQSEEAHLRDLLEEAGIRVRFYPKFVTVDDIRRAPEAEANAMTCVTHGLGFCEYMNQRFGIPYAKTNQVIGIKQTGRWLRLIARLVGKEKEMEEVIRREEAELYLQLKPLLPKLKGKKVYIDGGHGRAYAIIKLCDELGMEPVGTMIYCHDTVAQHDLKEAMEVVGEDFMIQVGPGEPNEQIPVMMQKGVDLFWGDIQQGLYAIRAGIPSMTIQSRMFRDRIGYKGVLDSAIEAVSLLENPGLPTLLGKHFSVYSDKWLRKKDFYRDNIPAEMVRF